MVSNSVFPVINNTKKQKPSDAIRTKQPFNGLRSGTTRVGQYQKKHSAFCLSIGLCCVQAVSPSPVFWIFMQQGNIMEAEIPTVRVGATPTGLTAPPTPQPPRFFYRPDALPATQPTASKH